MFICIYINYISLDETTDIITVVVALGAGHPSRCPAELSSVGQP